VCLNLPMFFILLTSLLTIAPATDDWVELRVPTKASLRGLSVVDDKVVWASGTNGTVIRTVDGGATWMVLPVAGAETLDFRGICGFDAEHAVVMSSGNAEAGLARIYRTEDGGKSWELVFAVKTTGVFLDALAFWDREHGIALSDPVGGRFVLYRTGDGGKTWKQIAPEKMPVALSGEGAFAASNSCLVARGRGNVWFASGGGSVARVFRSSDRGESWEVSETPMHPENASSGLFSLAFRDEKNGVAVGGDYAHAESSPKPNVLFTSDGGKTWSGGEGGAAGRYFSTVAYAEGAIVAAGSAGGYRWKEESGWRRERDENVNAIAFTNSGMGWAVGPNGKVARKSR
jgi:photosystem II stability/assembly factor-like uncharacterized protein